MKYTFKLLFFLFCLLPLSSITVNRMNYTRKNNSFNQDQINEIKPSDLEIVKQQKGPLVYYSGTINDADGQKTQIRWYKNDLTKKYWKTAVQVPSMTETGLTSPNAKTEFEEAEKRYSKS